MSEVFLWILKALSGIITESWHLLAQMAPYLLFGFLVAGVIHIFFSVEAISRHLGKKSFGSVLKATLFGIPLPLCSCSVIPAVASLRQSGASKGATLSFLISTPTSGVDSMLATYSLLGPFFMLYRVLASFLAGITAGAGANLFTRSEERQKKEVEAAACRVCGEELTPEHNHRLWTRVRAMITYSFGELVGDIGKWVLIGTLIGGAIAYFVPPGLISTYLSSPILQMLLMLAISIPLYICATGSLPVAAALIAKGISPGAALVFLIAGPATNTITLTVVSRTLGKRSLFIYLASIVAVAVILGLGLDFLLPGQALIPLEGRLIGVFEFPRLVEWIAAGILLALICYQFGLSIFSRSRHHRHEDSTCTDSSCSPEVKESDKR